MESDKSGVNVNLSCNRKKEEGLVVFAIVALHITASIHFESGLYRKLSTLSLQAGLVVLATICSIFVQTHASPVPSFRSQNLQENNASFAPYTQSRDLLVVGRLGDMTLKLKRCYRTFPGTWIRIME
jgi:hypothetical protein